MVAKLAKCREPTDCWRRNLLILQIVECGTAVAHRCIRRWLMEMILIVLLDTEGEPGGDLIGMLGQSVGRATDAAYVLAIDKFLDFDDATSSTEH